MTGHTAWWSTAWLVEPSSSPAKPPRPRDPTTTRSTAVENSASRAAALPSRACWLIRTSRPATACSTATLRPTLTSASTSSRSTAAGSQASEPALPPIGTAATAVRWASHRTASSTARRRAIGADSDLRVAVQGVLADPHVPAGDGLLDGDAEADLDVGEHVVAVHGCGQPGQRACAAADRDGGDRGEVGVPQDRLVHGTAQGDRRRL